MRPIFPEGLSMNDGICLFNTRYTNYVAISTIDEYGKITTQWVTIKDYAIKNKKKVLEPLILFHLLARLLFFIFMLIIMISVISDKYSIRFLWILPTIFSLLLISLLFLQRKKGEKAYRFHAAEHMVLNAYRELETVPTIDDIRKFSQYDNLCITNDILVTPIFSILLIPVAYIPNLFLRIIYLILFCCILPYILQERGYLNFLQKYNTMPPTDDELSVVIEALWEWDKNAKKGEGNF